jgi:hypothetical protein
MLEPWKNPGEWLPTPVTTATLALDCSPLAIVPIQLTLMLSRSAEYLTRAWCLFELNTAIGEHGKVEIDIILTETEQDDFVQTMASVGCTLSPLVLHGLRAAKRSLIRF